MRRSLTSNLMMNLLKGVALLLASSSTYFTTPVALLSLVGSVLSALTVDKYPGAPSGRYIVKVKDNVNKDGLISQIEKAHGEITHNWSIINGFAGKFDTTVLNLILERPDVEAVTKDGTATISGTQYNAPWGLSRISQCPPLPKGSNPNALTYPYFFPDNRLGESVDIYVVDTGVRISHQTFGGRAFWGKTFGAYADQDGNGHGTHVAGTAAGGQFGVAKKARIIAVKVLSDEGSGSYSDVISGLDWVRLVASRSGRPSVVNMSLGGPANIMVNQAVGRLTGSGVHVAVAAGNSNQPAELSSPASEQSACTVGASDINDARASFSNYGTPVKVFAPGVAITSAWIGSNTDVKTISGTSMASPHVAGLIAYLITAEGYLPPANMIQKIQAYAVRDALSNMVVPVPTVNFLAQNRRA